jgi:hypothetical protein
MLLQWQLAALNQTIKTATDKINDNNKGKFYGTHNKI